MTTAIASMEKSRLKVKRTAIILAVLVAGLFVTTVYLQNQASSLDIQSMIDEGTYIYESPRDLPDFRLQNANGGDFTPTNLENQWNLLFFGFTHCPEICPTTLADLKLMKKQLAPEFPLAVTMVTIDPERDDHERLKSYLMNFDESFVGVTGEQAEIFQLAKAVNVIYAKVNSPDALYSMDHSGHVAIVDPAGKFVGFRKNVTDVAVFRRHLSQLMAAR